MKKYYFIMSIVIALMMNVWSANAENFTIGMSFLVNL
jgi:hypothetical protein